MITDFLDVIFLMLFRQVCHHCVLPEMYRILKNYEHFYEVELNLLSPQYYNKYMTAGTVCALHRTQDTQ
jgi:hypothetical protein